ncbi:MAG: SPFH domain-containing protein [Candidatus Nanohaloarchaea archaeon]|nr:SPFH domain-containing protein [Candidatus Nanohaloarchaea archaeon]
MSPTIPEQGAGQAPQVDMSSASGAVVKLIIALVSAVVLGVAGAAFAGSLGALVGAGIGILVYFSIVINQEYERAVVFRLGGYSRVLGPGFNLKIPFVEWTQKVDYRVKTVNVQPQKVLTKDNVTVTVDAIVFYRVKKDADQIRDAVLEVEDFGEVTVNYGQTMLRAMIGKKELDEILQNRDEIADELRDRLDQATNDFGVHIRDVEIQDVSIPDSMERAMASEAEAERDRRARITHAQGELQAAARTRMASEILGSAGYKLRTLQTIDEVAKENSTVVTVPAELLPGTGGEELERGPIQDVMDQVRDQIDLDDLLGNAQNFLEQAK